MEVITLLKQHIFQTYNQLHHRAHNVITVCHVALLSEIWRSKDISRLPAWCVIEQVYTGHSLRQHIQYVGCQTRYIIGNGKSLLRVYRASKNVFYMYMPHLSGQTVFSISIFHKKTYNLIWMSNVIDGSIIGLVRISASFSLCPVDDEID